MSYKFQPDGHNHDDRVRFLNHIHYPNYFPSFGHHNSTTVGMVDNVDNIHCHCINHIENYLMFHCYHNDRRPAVAVAAVVDSDPSYAILHDFAENSSTDPRANMALAVVVANPKISD